MTSRAGQPLGALALAAALLAAPGLRAQEQAGSVFLNHPVVVDTAHLRAADQTVTLFGVKGEGGAAAQGLQAFITANGDRVTCHPHSAGGNVCLVPTGLDVAATALANGAAETIADSSADYRAQEASAQDARLGRWAALPPGPVTLEHPVVQTTAEITGDGHVFLLDGLVGFPAQYYTMQLQSYLAAHGDRLTCQEQPGGNAVCLLPDGTDIATVALLNGLARVGPDASATYHADQAKAVASRSGFWFNTPDAVLAALPPETVPPCCALDPTDRLAGLAYDNGVPTAVIDGAPAFFLYDGVLGWGFYDARHRWHPAPAAIAAHLERFHPEGRGLRVPAATAAAPGQVVAFRAPGFHGPGDSRPRPVFTSDITTAIQAPGLLPTPAPIRPLGSQAGGLLPSPVAPAPIAPITMPGPLVAPPLFVPRFVPAVRPAFGPGPVSRPIAPAAPVRPLVGLPAPGLPPPPPSLLGRH